MKSFKVITLQKFGCAILASSVLVAGATFAADTPATSPNTQGAGAAQLSGNSEEADSKSTVGSAEMPKDAKSFLKDAIEGNSAEVALAQVAERKAQSAEVRQFAQMLRRDHERANQQLQPIAQAHNVSLNQSLDSKHQKKLDRLQKLSGTEFDKEYATEMLKDHQKDIQKYEHASRNITESDVKQYVDSTLPKLRQHLQHAQHAAVAAGVDNATISSIMKKSDSMGGTQDKSEKVEGSDKSHSDHSME